MRVLLICNLPYAINSGGHKRLTHLLRGVASAGEVTLVYPTKAQTSDLDLEALSPYCREVHTFPFESLQYQRDSRLPTALFWAKHKMRYLHPFTSALIQELRSREGMALVANLCKQNFDIIWCQRISSLHMLPSSIASRVIIDLDDLEHRSLRSRLVLRKDPPHMLPLHWFEFFKLRRLERGVARLPYELAVCSDIDRQVVEGRAKAWVIPNGVELPTQPANPRQENSAPVLLFPGYMAYEPNADAALFFAKRILPLIRRTVPDAKFLVVGRDPTSAVRQLHDGKSVVVTGTVPEIAPYLDGASVVVAPIRFGGGTRIKILEALAYRKAVVSTTIGAEGIHVESGKHLLLADFPEDFARACTLLLKDAGFRNRLGEEGFSLVRNDYQWDRIEQIVRQIVSGTAMDSTRELCALSN
jgi:glycosyltransferase involved in cell wall biosynthesis